jgi:hypothetical protein
MHSISNFTKVITLLQRPYNGRDAPPKMMSVLIKRLRESLI